MSIATAKKRLQKIEDRLTPKEWAIRFADEIREYPSIDELCLAQIKTRVSTIHTAHKKLVEQAEARHPGRKAYAQQQADIQHTQIEFETLKNLVFKVNETVTKRTCNAETEAALKVQTLQTIILQDAFSQTVGKASTWIKGQKTTGQKSNPARQGLLAELAGYADTGGETGFRTMADVWADSVSALAFDLLCHKAAVALLQDTCFDGHAILAPDTETGLEAVVQTIRQAIEHFNEYLTVQGNRDSPLRINVDALSPSHKAVKSLADYWLAPARDEAIVDVLNWMCETVARDAHRRDMVKRMMSLTD